MIKNVVAGAFVSSRALARDGLWLACCGAAGTCLVVGVLGIVGLSIGVAEHISK